LNTKSGKYEADKLDLCESIIGHHFRDRALLLEALTHASNASDRLKSNERLEFLGDSILGFIVCDYLFGRFPEWSEGELTRVKSILVSRSSCALIADEIGIADVLFVGRGIAGAHRVPSSLLSNAFESLIAALFLDAGIDAVQQFVLPHVEDMLDDVLAGETGTNFKSDLQHLAQRIFGIAPEYVLLEEKGPDHAKSFQVAAVIGQRRFDPAWGRSKKQAEQRAASNALQQLEPENQTSP